MISLSPFIQAYLKDWKRISEMESYKWIAFKHFKENYNLSYDTFHSKLSKIFEKSENLLASRNYLPLGMLLDLSNPESGRTDRLQALFDGLLCAGELPTQEKVRNFIYEAKKIMLEMAESGYSDWKGRSNLNSYQDVHAISVYLSMFYPNDFYIYKYRVFKDFARITNHTITSNNHVERLFEFQNLCNEVKSELRKDIELTEFYNTWLKEHCFEDENLNLLTQDFIYAVARHLNSETYKKIGKNQKRARKVITISASDITSSKTTKHSYTGNKSTDYLKLAKQNSDLGHSGEMWVMNYEAERLLSLGLNPELVKHDSYDIGDGLGYDIRSVEDDGTTTRYIEVKTTTGGESQPIFFSDNEMSFSVNNKEHYYIYRVYNFKEAGKTADLTIVKGSLKDLEAEPIAYKASIKH